MIEYSTPSQLYLICFTHVAKTMLRPAEEALLTHPKVGVKHLKYLLLRGSTVSIKQRAGKKLLIHPQADLDSIFWLLEHGTTKEIKQQAAKVLFLHRYSYTAHLCYLLEYGTVAMKRRAAKVLLRHPKVTIEDLREIVVQNESTKSLRLQAGKALCVHRGVTSDDLEFLADHGETEALRLEARNALDIQLLTEQNLVVVAYSH